MVSDKSTTTNQTQQTYQGNCPACENKRVSTTIHEEEYVYGSGESVIRLPVKVPVHTCVQCELQFTDWEAEEIKHNALCQHFGVLNPTQIRQLRKKYGMSRNSFANLTGIGEASLHRWEKGINIQSIAHDRYLRLLDDPKFFTQLKRTVSRLDVLSSLELDINECFRTLKNLERHKVEQSWFELRLVA